MAKQKSTGFVGTISDKSEGRKKRPFGDITFVLNNLDNGQLEELDNLEKTPPDLYSFMSDCVDKGIDLKIGYDNYSKGYQAVATGAYDGFPSAGFATSGFSKAGADDALFVLWYKVAIICQFDLSSANGREKRTKQRG